MKYILGMPYALAKELHVSIEEAPLTIRTNQQVFGVKLNVDKGEVKDEKQEQSDWTEVEVRLPIVHKLLNFNKIKRFLADYVLFSTHVSFKFVVGDETMVFSQTQPNNKKWVNNSTCHYYSQTEFEYFIDKFDGDNAEVYTVMQRLFREGSVMKKAGLENMKMGKLKRSSELKKELFLRMRDAIINSEKREFRLMVYQVRKKSLSTTRHNMTTAVVIPVKAFLRDNPDKPYRHYLT